MLEELTSRLGRKGVGSGPWDGWDMLICATVQTAIMCSTLGYSAAQLCTKNEMCLCMCVCVMA